MKSGVTFLLAGFLVAVAVTVASEDGIPTVTVSASLPLPELPSYPDFKSDMMAKQRKVEQLGDEDASTSVAALVPTATPGKSVALADRINFASHSLGASIFSANKEAKGAASLLAADPDGYYMSPCSATKWVVIGLPEEILIDTVVLSNMERYSSPVHNFVLSGSKSGPNGDMDLLASFNASKTLGEQTFHLNPPGWARYVRLSMNTHYGSEFYCTLTSIKIYGKTVIEALQTNVDKLEHVNDGTGMTGNGGHVGLGTIEDEPELAALARTLLAVPDAVESPSAAAAISPSRTVTTSPTVVTSASPVAVAVSATSEPHPEVSVSPVALSPSPADIRSDIEVANATVSDGVVLPSTEWLNVSKPVTNSEVGDSVLPSTTPSSTESVAPVTSDSVCQSTSDTVPIASQPTPTVSVIPSSVPTSVVNPETVEISVSSSVLVHALNASRLNDTLDTEEASSVIASASASVPAIVVTAANISSPPLYVSASMVPSLLADGNGERPKDSPNATLDVLLDDAELYCGLDEDLHNASALDLPTVGNPAPAQQISTHRGRMAPLPTYSVIPVTGSSSMINIITKKLHELTQEQNVIRQYIMEFQQLFNLVSARMETSIDTNRQDIIELKAAVSPVPAPTALMRLSSCTGSECDESVVSPSTTQAYSMLHHDLQALRHDMLLLRHQYGAMNEELSVWRSIAAVAMMLMILVAVVAYKMAVRAVAR